MWSVLGLLVIFIIPGFGVFSHGFKKKQIQTDDILLDGRIYRQVGEYEEVEEDIDAESNLDEEDTNLHPLKRLFKSVMGLWKGKKLKSHSKHGKHMDENGKASEPQPETFDFHSQFQWLHEGKKNPKFKFRSNPIKYKPKYSFKSKQEKFFEQVQGRKSNRRTYT